MRSFDSVDREPLAVVPLLVLLRFLLAFLARSFGCSIFQLASFIALTSSRLFRLVHEPANLRDSELGLLIWKLVLGRPQGVIDPGPALTVAADVQKHRLCQGIGNNLVPGMGMR